MLLATINPAIKLNFSKIFAGLCNRGGLQQAATWLETAVLTPGQIALW